MYKDIRPRMRTGDVIAFSGKGLTSNWIKGYTRSDISHVGIVYKTVQDRVVIMESTTLNNIPDIATGRFVKGVQQQNLSDRLNNYTGQAYWLKLVENIRPINHEIMLEWLKDVHGTQTKYDSLGAILAGSYVVDFAEFAREEDFSSLFCSELVCKALQLAGVVSDKILAGSQTPADIMRYQCLDERIRIK